MDGLSIKCWHNKEALFVLRQRFSQPQEYLLCKQKLVESHTFLKRNKENGLGEQVRCWQKKRENT